jgi:hypothetical protein
MLKTFPSERFEKPDEIEYNFLFISKYIQIDKSINHRLIAKFPIHKDTVILIETPSFDLFGDENEEPALQIIYKMFNASTKNHIDELFPRFQSGEKKRDQQFIRDIKQWTKNIKNKKLQISIEKIPIETKLHYYKKYYYNAFSMGEFGPSILIYGAKFNHSCDPNVCFEIEKFSNKIIFKTLRNIDTGEELFISYLDIKKSYQERQAYLLDHYGFICKCKKCNFT